MVAGPVYTCGMRYPRDLRGHGRHPPPARWPGQARVALRQAQRHGEQVALLFFDLNRFKNINDTLGHTLGDLLLQQVAQRLERVVQQHGRALGLALPEPTAPGGLA